MYDAFAYNSDQKEGQSVSGYNMLTHAENSVGNPL